MPPLIRRFVWLAAAVVLVVAVISLWPRMVPEQPEKARRTSGTGKSPAKADAPQVAHGTVLDEALRGAFSGNGKLGDLRAALRDAPPAEALAFIRSFIDSGKDQATGMEFEIGAGGSLTSWPTLRTMLLDLLPDVDPAASAEMARKILQKPTTADEWALALRNVAWAEELETSRDFLRQKTEELIRNPSWQANPSVGYLNAFDVLVHTKATESAPLLSSLVQNKDRKDLSHAAFLTLDRLVQRQPEAMLGQLSADTALQQARPEMTAQQFARADLRDEEQREIVKQWLLDPKRTSTELQAFTGVYPNQNQFVSNNLLTTSEAPSGADLAAHDREVLEILAAWQADPAFKSIDPHLNTLIRRLTQFTAPKDGR